MLINAILLFNRNWDHIIIQILSTQKSYNMVIQFYVLYVWEFDINHFWNFI